MSIQHCDFCREELTPEGPRHFYRLGLATCLHCDKPDCRAKGKEWRVQQLKGAAIALGLAEKTTDSPIPQG